MVFVIFQAAHSKLVSYIFPMFPALALIAGDYVFDAASSKGRNRIFYALSIFIAAVLFAIPVAGTFLAPKYASFLSSRPRHMPSSVYSLSSRPSSCSLS